MSRVTYQADLRAEGCAPGVQVAEALGITPTTLTNVAFSELDGNLRELPVTAGGFAPGETHLTGDALQVEPVGTLIGWNIGQGTLYGPAGDPLHPEWRTPEHVQAFARLREIRPREGARPHVRFSGLQIDGTIGGDGYHFFQFADPAHIPAATDNMAPFQYMAIVDEIDASPLATLNFGSGTAQEAADYVTHLVGTDANDPLVAARHHWGNLTPFAPRAHEIGNEVYGFWNTASTDTGAFSYANPAATNGGDPPWYGRPASDPADFAARALEYVEAVVAVDPDARLWVPVGQSSMEFGWGTFASTITALAPLLEHPAVETSSSTTTNSTTRASSDSTRPCSPLRSSCCPRAS